MIVVDFSQRYIELIYKILKPGGYWINLGPLLYHWQVGLMKEINVQSSDDITDEEMDERYQRSIELSYEEIQNVMKKVGFSIKESNRICTPYTDNMYVL